MSAADTLTSLLALLEHPWWFVLAALALTGVRGLFSGVLWPPFRDRLADSVEDWVERWWPRKHKAPDPPTKAPKRARSRAGPAR